MPLDDPAHLRLRVVLGAVAGFLAAVPLTALALAVRVGTGTIPRLDRAIAQWAHDAASPHPLLVHAASAIQTVFSPWVFRGAVLLLVVYLIRQKALRLAWWAAVTMAAGSLLGLVLKLVVARARPVLETPLGTAAGYSFPSGHALNSLVGTLVILLAILPSLRTRPARIAAWAIGAGIVLITGADRIILGVHYPSDVVGGWIAGLALTAGTAAAFETWRLERGRPPSGPMEGVEPEAGAAVARPMPGAKRWGRRLARLIALPGVLLYGLLVGAGLLIAGPLAGLVSGEQGLEKSLADGRSPGWSAVTAVISALANTPAIVAMLVASMLILRIVTHRWREPVMLLTAVAVQVTVFLLTTLVVVRDRPTVPHLDEAPPTSSFPSGHTGAATALSVTLAVIVSSRIQRGWLRAVVIAALACFPLAVALSRLYRGMHHPSDVVFGALNGLACVLIAVHAARHDRDGDGEPDAPAAGQSPSGRAPRRELPRRTAA